MADTEVDYSQLYDEAIQNIFRGNKPESMSTTATVRAIFTREEPREKVDTDNAIYIVAHALQTNSDDPEVDQLFQIQGRQAYYPSPGDKKVNVFAVVALFLNNYDEDFETVAAPKTGKWEEMIASAVFEDTQKGRGDDYAVLVAYVQVASQRG